MDGLDVRMRAVACRHGRTEAVAEVESESAAGEQAVRGCQEQPGLVPGPAGRGVVLRRPGPAPLVPAPRRTGPPSFLPRQARAEVTVQVRGCGRSPFRSGGPQKGYEAGDAVGAGPQPWPARGRAPRDQAECRIPRGERGPRRALAQGGGHVVLGGQGRPVPEAEAAGGGVGLRPGGDPGGGHEQHGGGTEPDRGRQAERRLRQAEVAAPRMDFTWSSFRATTGPSAVDGQKSSRAAGSCRGVLVGRTTVAYS
ncbi:hypothetical protein SAMN05428939_7220 [Streptomyces sp. TLI_105]|nr:hypothetical protein SAMN05428939_7220 [Streptomyces sp. TLI_105]